jgi:hypothetical protein
MSNGTQISDMTGVAFDDAPDEATFPWVVENPSGGYVPSTNYRTNLIEQVRARVRSADLISTDPSEGAALVGDDDGASGSLWTTVKGFITYLRSSVGAGIVGFLQAGTGAVARTTLAKLRESVSVLDFGAVGDNATNDTVACQKAIDTGKNVLFPVGYTFLVDGLTIATAKQQMLVQGVVKKRAGSSVSTSVFTINDVDWVQFVGDGEINGNWDAFTFPTDAVSGIVAYRAGWLLIDGVTITEFINCGLLAYNCPNLVVTPSTRFYKGMVNGIEITSYLNDPRTSAPWVGGAQSPSGNISGIFEWIDDGQQGANEGNGVIFATRQALAKPVVNLRVSGVYRNCLRGIWNEDNVNVPSRNIVIDGPVIWGNPDGTDGIQTKDGIGLVNAINAAIISPTLYNIGNFAPPDAECTAITISGNNTDGVSIISPMILDDSGNTDRTDYGIRINGGANISVTGGSIQGCSVANFYIWDDINVVVSDLRVQGVFGAEVDFSWGPVTRYAFALQNVPTGAATELWAEGQTNIKEAVMGCAGKVVGMTVRLSAIGTGNYTFKVFIAGIEQPDLELTQTEFGGGAQAVSRISTIDAAQAVSGAQLTTSATTDGTWVNTVDALVSVFVDHGFKPKPS